MEPTPPLRPVEKENKERLKKRILLAEDDVDNSTLMVRALRKAGYGEIEVVEDGAALVEVTSRGDKKFDLIISDHDMPKLDGLDALEQLYEKGLLRDTSIIVHSTVADNPEIAERIKKIKAISVEKGISGGFAELVKKVKEVLETNKEESS